MFNRGLLLGGFNPPHYGHYELIKVALDDTLHLDILIGLKPKHQLPYAVRAAALSLGLLECDIHDRVNILPEGKFHDADLTSYDVFIAGSDVFNKFHPQDHRHSTPEKKRFDSFPNLIVLEREGVPINEHVLEAMRLRHQVEIYQPRSPISATLVRQHYQSGKSVFGLMPPASQQVIDRHSYLFM